MLKDQIGQILTMSKIDQPGLCACFQATYVANRVDVAQAMTEKIPEFEINLRLKKFYKTPL